MDIYHCVQFYLVCTKVYKIIIYSMVCSADDTYVHSSKTVEPT